METAASQKEIFAVAYEWFEPHFHFGTMTRKPGCWAPKAVIRDDGNFAFNPTCAGRLLEMGYRDACDLFSAGSMSVEEMELRKDQVAVRHEATVIDPAWEVDITTLNRLIGSGKLDDIKLARAEQERARLEGLIDMANYLAIAAE